MRIEISDRGLTERYEVCLGIGITRLLTEK